MQRRSLLVTAALTAGLALGIVAGPAIHSASASAQTLAAGQAQTAAAQDPLQTLFLDKLAGALNIQRSALDTAIKTAGLSTADAAVQQGILTQAQADALKTRIQNGEVVGFGDGPRGGGPHGGEQVTGLRQAMIDAAAKTLKITSTELTTQLRSGQTIAQLAQAHGTTEKAVIDAALAAAKTQLTKAVTAGTLTQVQADAIYARLQTDGAKLLGPGGDHGPGGGGRGHPRPGQTNPQSPATGPGL